MMMSIIEVLRAEMMQDADGCRLAARDPDSNQAARKNPALLRVVYVPLLA
jgi:hypothetical protein